MSVSVRKKIKTGAASLLFLLCAFFAPQAARADFSDFFFVGDDIGSAKIPRFGSSRILVVFATSAPAAAPTRLLDLFGIDAPGPALRDYFRAASISQYDPKPEIAFVAAPRVPVPSGIPRFGEDSPWRGFALEILEHLAASESFVPAEFDINGADGTPDGYLDGIIIVADGVVGAHAFPGDVLPGAKFGIVALGPFVLAGPDASEFEILRAFARALGFAPISPGPDGRGGGVLSLMGAPDKGIPLIDGYSRLRAGWAKPILVADSPRLFFILPALDSGEIYITGGAHEFFLVENRRPASGLDTSLSGPGLAVFHIDETRLVSPGSEPADSDPVWRPVIMNKWPDASYPLQRGLPAASDDALFRDGVVFKSDYSAQNPLSDKRHPLNSNFHSGEPSDFVIKDIDVSAHFPMITATMGIE
jgi:hypothetical protein